jgi:hypothetical protein
MLGRAHRYPSKTPCYIYFQQIYAQNFLNMLQTIGFLHFKCLLFYNATFFGSCIVRILYAGCAKI